MVEAVLQTDMAQHKAMVDALQARVDAAAAAAAAGAISLAAAAAVDGTAPLRQPGASPLLQHLHLIFRPEVPEDRQKLVSLLLHTADLHSAVQNFSLDKTLAYQVAAEFGAQAEAERRHGLKVTVMDGSTPLALASMVRCCSRCHRPHARQERYEARVRHPIKNSRLPHSGPVSPFFSVMDVRVLRCGFDPNSAAVSSSS